MHEGYFDEGWDILAAYVKYEHPDRVEDARKDLNSIFDGLIKLDKNNISDLVKKYGGNVLLSDIHYSNTYANYVILSLPEDEIFDYTTDDMQLGNRLEFLLHQEDSLINSYLDVYNTELKNYRYPFPK